jgi:hypothetical protein
MKCPDRHVSSILPNHRLGRIDETCPDRHVNAIHRIISEGYGNRATLNHNGNGEIGQLMFYAVSRGGQGGGARPDSVSFTTSVAQRQVNEIPRAIDLS